MAEGSDPFVNEYGISLFDLVLTAYDLWLDGIPYVGPSAAGVQASSRRLLMQDVYPSVRQLCIRLEANQKGELASRIERDFHDLEDNARDIDAYCESEEFDFNLWFYGDSAMDRIAPVNKKPDALLEQARALEEPDTDEDFQGWILGREWTLDVGSRCEEIEIEKYGHTAMPGYARRVACWTWSCFWLAAQLRHQEIDHVGAGGYVETYLAGMWVVSETKERVIHEAMGRAYGMRIYPIEPIDKEETQRAIKNFGAVVTETQDALLGTSPPEAKSSDEPAVTLIRFMQKYCQGGESLSESILDSRRNSIQNAAQFKKIALPDNVGKWKTGQAKYYRPRDLAKLWPSYCEKLPNLPALKTTNLPPAGRTA